MTWQDEPTPPSGEANSAPRILIVEHDPETAMLHAEIFRALGAESDHATTAAQALAMNEGVPYRMVLANWGLPDGSCADLCRTLRQADRPYVYFLVAGPRQDPAFRDAAFNAGADDLVSSPMNPSDARARLTVANRILEMEDRLQQQKGQLEELSVSLQATNGSLEVASKRFEALFGRIPVGCFTLDATGAVYEWNRTAEETFGIPAYLAIFNTIWSLLGNTFWNAQLIDRILEGESFSQTEWEFKGPDGKLILNTNIEPLRGPDGNCIGAICSSADITAIREAERKIDAQLVTIQKYADELADQKAVLEEANIRLNQLALTDGLTGLLNHRSLQEELDRALSSGDSCSLILLDVDKFKQYNDSFGHPAGDEVLRRVAKIARDTVGDQGKPARHGGEEFAVLMTGCSEKEAEEMAEQIRFALEDEDFPNRDVTASFGVAHAVYRETPASLITRSDRALYDAKHEGRNCVRVSDTRRAIQRAA